MTDRIGVDVSEVSRDLETWLPVPGYEGYYEVSDLGRVRALDRIVTLRASRVRDACDIRLRAHEMKTFEHTYPGRLTYLLVRLSKDNRQESYGVHRLVLMAFVGPAPEETEGCHWNGDSLDNRLENLRWGTKSDNRMDSVRHGTHARTSRTKCPRGHKLVDPNLNPCCKPWRNCLACARTLQAKYKAQRRNQPFNFQAVSDEKYAKIMGVAA